MTTPKITKTHRESVCRIHVYPEAFKPLLASKPADMNLTEWTNMVIEFALKNAEDQVTSQSYDPKLVTK